MSKQFRKRSAILAYLRQSDEHPSAEMVFQGLKPDFPDLSLGTVYRNLAMFKQQGQIRSLGTVDGVERFDGKTEPHVHFICSSCARIRDMPQICVPELLTGQAEQCTGGRVRACQMTFIGVCRHCLENDQKGGEAV